MQRSGDDLGLIAPGRRADIAVFRDLAGFEARLVLASGRPVARDGACLAPIREPETPPFTDTMKLSNLRPEDFQIARTVRWLGSIRSASRALPNGPRPGGKLLALLGLPVCGLLSDRPTAEVAEALSALRDAAAEVADWLPPLRSFKSLVGASDECATEAG